MTIAGGAVIAVGCGSTSLLVAQLANATPSAVVKTNVFTVYTPQPVAILGGTTAGDNHATPQISRTFLAVTETAKAERAVFKFKWTRVQGTSLSSERQGRYHSSMASLFARAVAGLLFLLAVMSALLFVPAGSTHYWQASVFLAVFATCVTAITLYLMKHDPKLLARRVKGGPAAEKEPRQQLIQSIATLAFVAIFVICGLDRRFAWSMVPDVLAFGGDAMVALGLLIVFFVFRENSFTSATIEIDSSQTVIATGPYALVRHPMYAGAFVMLIGTPLALASWWGMLAVIPLAAVIVWRLLDEERFLTNHLAGYKAYLSRVRYRLLPYVW